MANKITEREIYTAMINGTIDAETLREFAEKKIAQLDRRNASAAKRAAAKRAEGDEVTEAVFALLDGEAKTRDEVTEMYNEANGSEFSVAKIGAKLNALVKAERIAKETIKVAGADGKVSNKVGYYRQ